MESTESDDVVVERDHRVFVKYRHFDHESGERPLTMTVAGKFPGSAPARKMKANGKQVLTILWAICLVFHLNITPANMTGIVLTLPGSAWCGASEYEEKSYRLMVM